MSTANLGYRIRNCFTLRNATALFIGVGVVIVGIFAPRVFAGASQRIAVLFFWVGIGLIVIGLATAVWRYIKNPIEQKQRVFSIISVLDRMYKRLEALVEKEKNKEVDMEAFREVSEKVVKLMAIKVPEVSSANEAMKVVESFEKELPTTMFPSDTGLEKRARVIVRVSRLMDRVGYGLKGRRRGDRRYRRLLGLVDEYYDKEKEFVDEELRSLIRTCVVFNESAANFLLYKERLNAVLGLAASSGVPNILTPSLESNIEGFSDEAREVSRIIRVRVGEKIRSLVKGIDDEAKNEIRGAISELEREVITLGGKPINMAELFWKMGDCFIGEGIKPGSTPGNIYKVVEGADEDEYRKSWSDLKRKLRLLGLICDEQRPHPYRSTGYMVIVTTSLGASVLNELDRKWGSRHRGH